MDRTIIYPEACPLDTDFLKSQRNAMVALGHLVQATLGSDPVADGLDCGPSSPPAMSVMVGPGMVAQRTAIDGSNYGSLASDANLIMKIGGITTSTSFELTPPVTGGQSVKYLIQAAFDESDTDPMVLSYYNAADPSEPFTGPGNAGTSQNTRRKVSVSLQAKRGTPATTGSETVPAPTAGYLPLWVVTVAYGQLTVAIEDIELHEDAPFVQSKLAEKWAPIASPAFTGTPTAPTPAQGNNSTRLATTEYVDALLSGATVAVAATANTIAKRDGTGGLTATQFNGPATSALTSSYANTSGTANSAANATYATTAGSATSATTAANATNATTAQNALKLANKLANTSAVADTIALRDSGGNLTATEFSGTATSAEYADLAERYAASEPLEPGDVVDLGGPMEIKKAATDSIGVISTDPAFKMNAAAGDDLTHPFVALTGRVPCKVIGPVQKGDYLCLSPVAGVAQGGGSKANHIGRALADKSDAGIGLVLALIK